MPQDIANWSLDKFKLVLVERGTGSLKDALQQIVVQLGPEFEKHVDRVRGAIEKLSVSTARATLAFPKLALGDRAALDR